MFCAHCNRPPSEHTVLPDRGHPTTGCTSYAFSFDPALLPRFERQVANMKRAMSGEVFVRCHCLDTENLKPCSNCGFSLCPVHHDEHEANCKLPKNSRAEQNKSFMKVLR